MDKQTSWREEFRGLFDNGITGRTLAANLLALEEFIALVEEDAIEATKLSVLTKLQGLPHFASIKDQPCEAFRSKERTPYGDPQPHQCPRCEGTRTFCDHCSTDHHEGGWRLCFFRELLR